MTGTTTSGVPARTASASVVIWLLVGSAFVMILNETIMSVALRVLAVELAVTESTAGWLTSGFLLTMGVVIPVTGFLLQRFPTRAVYLASMSLFSVGTLICALAPGFAVLLLGRIVQASGTAVMIPLLFTSVMTLVPAEQRGRTMGRITVVIAVAPAVGPTISGLILSALDWRWMFWTVLPIALVALALGAAKLHVASETRRVPLDVVSVLISAVAFSGLVFGLSSIGESARGASLLPPWVPVVVGVVALAVFVARQLRLQRDDRALLDLRPFTHRQFVVSLLLVGLGFMALFGAVILLPLYIQAVLREAPFVAGLVVLPGGLAMGLLGPTVGRLYDRIGPRPLVIPGAAVLCGGMWLMTALGAASPILAVAGIYVALSLGLAFMFTPLMTDALGSLPSTLYSHGSAILATLQQVAAAAGTALFLTVMTVYSVAPGRAPDVPGLRAAFVCAAIVSVLALGVALLVRRGKLAPAPTPGHA